MEKIKVAVIPSWYPNGQDRLMGQYHIEFSEALAEAGVDVSMLVVERARLKRPISFLLSGKARTDRHSGFSAYVQRQLNISPISFKLQQKSYERALHAAYLQYSSIHGKPDIIHAMVSVPAGYAACRLGREIGVPVVVTEHASYFKRFFTGAEKPYGDTVLKNARLTAVSHYMAEQFKNDLNTDCEVLPNVVDTAVFKPSAGKRGGRLTAVVECALRQGKRIDDAAAAIKLLMQSGRVADARLIVIGDGFKQAEYKEAVERIGMAEYTQFVGRKSKAEIAEIFKTADLMIVASQLETFCIPAIEALAAGLPVVSTRCRGPEEFLTEPCGELCPVGDIQAMADAVYKVYTNLNSYDPQVLAKTAAAFSKQAVAEKAIDIYKKILED